MDTSDEMPTSSTNERSRGFFKRVNVPLPEKAEDLPGSEIPGDQAVVGDTGPEVESEVPVGIPLAVQVGAHPVVDSLLQKSGSKAASLKVGDYEFPLIITEKIPRGEIWYMYQNDEPRVSAFVEEEKIRCPNCGNPYVPKGRKIDPRVTHFCNLCKYSWKTVSEDAIIVPEEIRHTDPDTGGQKGVKPQRYSLMPWGALDKVAELYGSGAQKYAEHNWRLGYDWSKSMDALMRHLKAWWEEGEEIDPDRHCHHLTAVVFHALALLEFTETHPEKDDRYISKKDVWKMSEDPSGEYHYVVKRESGT